MRAMRGQEGDFQALQEMRPTQSVPGQKTPLPDHRPIMVIALLAGALWSAGWVAKFRADQAMSDATSFVVPREPKGSGSNRGGGGRGAGDLNWR